MLQTKLTIKALDICYKAHNMQFDKGGAPYVEHPKYLAEQFDSEEEVCVALLHDVLEDSGYTEDDLRKEGFSEIIIEAVTSLTRQEGEDYFAYIRKIKENDLATRIKIKDLMHNSDETRIGLTTDKDICRIEKYKEAMKVLLEQ